MDWDTHNWLTSNFTPLTPLHCAREDVIPVCFLDQAEQGKRDALAGLRLVVSTLSLLGASSIIYSAIRRKRVCSSKVHPLFVLSIADVMLAILWATGAILWLGRSEEMKRGWCLAVSLITIIVECAAINLTFVYALLAYLHIKTLDFGAKRHYNNGPTGVLTAGNNPALEEKSCNVWHPLKSTLIYSTAWVLPLILIMLPFSIIVTVDGYPLLDHVRDCTCWCQPAFGNVIPQSVFSTNATARYSHEFRKILLHYGVVISTHYLVVFILLVVCYVLILRHIHRLQRDYNKYHGTRRYGTIKIQINQAQSQARRRVVAFIIVFIITGFSNLVLSLLFTVHEANQLVIEDKNNLSLRGRGETPVWVLTIFYCQSLTVPMQGFLNALVYGWTRDDFVNSVSKPLRGNTNSISQPVTKNPNFQNEENYSSDEGVVEDQRDLTHSQHGNPKLGDSSGGLVLSGSMNGVEHNQVYSHETQTDFETDREDDKPDLEISKTISIYNV